MVVSNIFLCSPRNFGEDEPILTFIFFNWVVQPLTRECSPLGIPHFLIIGGDEGALAILSSGVGIVSHDIKDTSAG